MELLYIQIKIYIYPNNEIKRCPLFFSWECTMMLLVVQWEMSFWKMWIFCMQCGKRSSWLRRDVRGRKSSFRMFFFGKLFVLYLWLLTIKDIRTHCGKVLIELIKILKHALFLNLLRFWKDHFLEVQSALVKYKVALQKNKQTEIWIRLYTTFIEFYHGDIRKLFDYFENDVDLIRVFIKKEFPIFIRY